MLANKIELFGVVSIWVSTVCAHKCQSDDNVDEFKKKAILGIVIAGAVITVLPF